MSRQASKGFGYSKDMLMRDDKLLVPMGKPDNMIFVLRVQKVTLSFYLPQKGIWVGDK